MGVVATAGHHGLDEMLHGEEHVCHLPVRPAQPDAYHGFQHGSKRPEVGRTKKKIGFSLLSAAAVSVGAAAVVARGAQPHGGWSCRRQSRAEEVGAGS